MTTYIHTYMHACIHTYPHLPPEARVGISRCTQVEEKHLTHSEQLMQLQKVTETTSQHFVEDLWSWW